MVVRSTRYFEIGGACDHCILTDSSKKVDRLAKGRNALRMSLAKPGTRTKAEKGVHCLLDGSDKTVGERKSGVQG